MAFLVHDDGWKAAIVETGDRKVPLTKHAKLIWTSYVCTFRSERERASEQRPGSIHNTIASSRYVP
jgi:hypothetical protein